MRNGSDFLLSSRLQPNHSSPTFTERMTKTTKAYLALIFLCIVWGTTYLALRIAVVAFPAFLLAAIRQLVSGMIILGIGYSLSRQVDVSFRNLRHQALVGFLLITMGNGLVSWGEKYVPSGVAALICSLMPICAVVINLLISKKERINPTILIGMLLGMGGVGLIFKDDVAALSDTRYMAGMLAIFIATASWALGSVLSKKKIHSANPIFNAGLQVLLGGLFLLVLSPFIDPYDQLNILDHQVLFPLLYLIIFGSVIAYTAYMFALTVLPVGIVTLYAYVNPLVAVVLGYLWLQERLTVYTLLAFVAIVSGVYLVNFGYRRQQRKEVASTSADAG